MSGERGRLRGGPTAQLRAGSAARQLRGLIRSALPAAGEERALLGFARDRGATVWGHAACKWPPCPIMARPSPPPPGRDRQLARLRGGRQPARRAASSAARGPPRSM
eukprot:1500871-Pyramimonas_sp.AAC.1